MVDARQPPGTALTYHIVAPGETLYSIAWRYNLNYKKLAKNNGIGRSYTIYPGQKLSLVGGGKAARKSSAASAKSSTKTSSVGTKVAPKAEPTRLKNQAAGPKNHTAKKSAQKKPSWAWPANGRLITRFNANSGLSKGIDIASNLREPVRAASSGTVVYSGEGLRGYGKLLIIKHSDKYLSAYAHNHRLLVKEGQLVNKGEKIAEMGETGTDSVKLHFEIRYDGKPVDPLAYLPPR
ncbi:peptidoglycan DD-metalloendopeptidase family protein [Agaribacterium haliotis]|uniref:peptidoglycan DD-metalloendopeptidase family protein n=1 Tax=Agaribacterium haliotis TaxID=2013869 RepID=UPI001EFD24FF|nr:peptidoglycan DD-metalloendopeptidase family protein [Agaribacterium haliotis]